MSSARSSRFLAITVFILQLVQDGGNRETKQKCKLDGRT